MKRSLLLIPLLTLLAACGQTTASDDPPANPTSPTVATTASPAPASTTAPPAIAPETPPPPAEPIPVTVVEPYVVECYQGTPGPALFSDGEMRHSDWCFETQGGPAYLEIESSANQPAQVPTGTTSTRGYSCSGDAGCFWPDGSPVAGADRCGVMCGEAPTSGEMQMKNGCEGGYITEPGLCDDPWWK